MAEGQSMTLEQVVRDVMAGEQADVLRESVRLVVQELMNAEVSELIGAKRRHPRAGIRSRVALGFVEKALLTRATACRRGCCSKR